ncbi:hypothetical protein HPB48_005995 [Haemaphysalis longicornis]|uniref:Uncharacterized protein n=1 Tax=Haemaphysalis longicornis TaxID=44386 RepID=A0A9J6FM23_HAELO|nr:hypothetical protein HPB48_005995 [Haemaphysalis longicornis]
MIRKFRLDDVQFDFPGVKRVVGSNSLQTAYRLSRKAELVLPTRAVFPLGIPEEFSFVTTFRKRGSRTDTWSIIRVTDVQGSAQFGLNVLARKNRLGPVHTRRVRKEADAPLPERPGECYSDCARDDAQHDMSGYGAAIENRGGIIDALVSILTVLRNMMDTGTS